MDAACRGLRWLARPCVRPTAPANSGTLDTTAAEVDRPGLVRYAAVGGLAPQWMGQDAVMRVRFVGSGDAFGSGGRWQTCIHLAAEGQVVLVVCGATSLTALKAQGLDPNIVGAVVTTCMVTISLACRS